MTKLIQSTLRHLRRNIVVLGGTVIVSPILVVTVFAVMKDHILGPTAAAWVQASGAVTAVVGAVWVSNQQANAQRELVQSSERRKFTVLLHLSQQLLDAFEAAFEDISSGALSFAASNMDSIAEALAEVRLMDLPSGEAAIAIINQRRNEQFFRKAFQAAQGAIVQIRMLESSIRDQTDRNGGMTPPTAEVDNSELALSGWRTDLTTYLAHMSKYRSAAKQIHQDLMEQFVAV